MRQLHEHQASVVNDLLYVTALDSPAYSHAHHKYAVTIGRYETSAGASPSSNLLYTLNFHQGSKREPLANGITDDVLLAIVADRLRGYMSGPFKSPATAHALAHVEEAMNWLWRQAANSERAARCKTPNKL